MTLFPLWLLNLYYIKYPINKQAFNSSSNELKACLFFLAYLRDGPGAGSLRSPLPRQASKNDENEGRSAIFACLSFLAWDELPGARRVEKKMKNKKREAVAPPSFYVV